MKKWIALITMATVTTLSSYAFAHGAASKHGGIMQSANDLQFELVNNKGAATIYIEDHGRPVSAAGATGKLTVLNGADKKEFAIEPRGSNALASKGDVGLKAGSKVVAAITFADKKEVSVRFAVK
jgi:hypothetical protein